MTSLKRFQTVDSTLHGVVDYVVGSSLLTWAPKALGIEGTRSARQVRLSGAFHAGYSTLTDYPLGAAKVIPYKAHLGLDLLGAAVLAATPFMTGQWREGRRQWVPHVGLALFEVMSLLQSDPSGKGSRHGDTSATHAANDADPDAAIRGGGLAVTPGAATGAAGGGEAA